MKILMFFILMTVFSVSRVISGTNSIHLIPKPQSINVYEGYFEVNPSTVIIASEELNLRAKQLRNYLEPATGYDIHINPGTKTGNTLELYLSHALENLGKEGYILQVSEKRVQITAFHTNGIFYGIQSLRQLLPIDIMRDAKVGSAQWKIPCLKIEDKPRFPWRGLMIDYSRTFWNKDLTKKYIDALALYKMNVLHMHLTDDQGWRIEIKKYPKLTQKASRFSDEFDEPEERQGYYTQEDIKELVAYAMERNIEIVPEIEMPGHTAEVFSVFPELSCKEDTFKIHPFFKGPHIHREILCAGKNETFGFLENVLAEIVDLFPFEYIHIGGDEAPKQHWQECPKCQQRIKDEKLKDEHELQSWFVRRIETYLNSKGKKLIGWNEILQGGLAPNAAVMFWHGEFEETLKAAEKGHSIVMSPTSHCYFDYTHEKISTEKVYSFNPVPRELDKKYVKNILGVQANFWSHIDRTEPKMSRQIFPRLLALSEVGWTNEENKEWRNFFDRIKIHADVLNLHNIYYTKSELQGYNITREK